MEKDISFILNHLGEDREDYFNAVSPPIIQSSNFNFKDIATMRAALPNEFTRPFYTRGANPTVTMLRKKLAALEGAEDALVFGSGVAAISAAVLSCVKAGDHIICVHNPYSWTTALLNEFLARFGVTHTMVDGTEVSNFEKAITPETKVIFLESPNTMTFELQDLEAVSALAKKHNITTIIDNSYSTPLHQNPISWGVDIVVHSASKYINGHSDIVAGVLCTTSERVKKIYFSEFLTLGGIISPHDAWLMLRGLRTLQIRMKHISESTEKVVGFLENHPLVEKVLDPFSTKNPQQLLAKKQMKKCGGLFSILLKADKIEQAETFANTLERFLIACSWGGHESLIYPICALYGTGHNNKSHLPWNLVRIYIGLEEPEVLIEDLNNALDAMRK